MKQAALAGSHAASGHGTVGIGEPTLLGGMPLILSAAEGDLIDRTGEESGLPGAVIVKCNPHGMRILLIAIHQHQRPVAIRPPHYIGRHQRIAIGVLHVTR